MMGMPLSSPCLFSTAIQAIMYVSTLGVLDLVEELGLFELPGLLDFDAWELLGATPTPSPTKASPNCLSSAEVGPL